MSIYKKYIQKLIEEEINKSLIEQDLPDEPAGDAPGGETTAVDAAGGGEEALDLDLGGEAGDVGAAPEGDAGDLGGDLGAGATGTDELGGEEGEEGLGDEGGGGFGGGFGGGGGFSFGSSGEEGLTPDEEGEEDTATTVGPEDVEKPTDPVMAIADEATKMLQTTRQPNVILKSVKSSMQKYFDSFEDATPVIKALWDTEDITLRDVAKRLLTFIKGAR